MDDREGNVKNGVRGSLNKIVNICVAGLDHIHNEGTEYIKQVLRKKNGLCVSITRKEEN